MQKKKTFQINAKGNSMFPILRDGDTIEYIQTPFSQIKLNDIVLVYSKEILVTHRVIYKTKSTCITRGDNNKAADTTIQKGRVLAKVVRFRRAGKWYGIQDVYMSQSTLYLNEINKLTAFLTLHKIPHVFLKGVLISLRYESRIPQRVYADCDILVRRAEQVKIEQAFSVLGYILSERALWQPRRLPRPQSGKARLNNKPEVSYVKMVRGVPVVFDVHFEPVFLMTQLRGMNVLYPSRKLDQLGRHIIDNKEIRKLKGQSYPLCSPSDQILYLALHIFHHNFTDSMRYQLLDAVIRKGFRQWDELAQTIKEYQLEGYVYEVFVLLKKYFHTSIPPVFFSSIRPPSFKFQVLSLILKHTNIFSQDTRTKAGIQRFLLIFLLSPNPIWKKALLFIHPEVVATAIRLIFSFLSARVFQAKKQSAQVKASDYQ
jgi:signal peptidase I